MILESTEAHSELTVACRIHVNYSLASGFRRENYDCETRGKSSTYSGSLKKQLMSEKRRVLNLKYVVNRSATVA